MKQAQNTQAVSPVIGFILVVGILIAVLASVQLVLVPMWNQDIEFSHNQRMQSSMQQLDSKINNVMQSGTRDSITLELGADIPKRPLLFDLPNQPGSLRTGNNSVVSIQNAAALNPDAADYWDGTPRNYSTRSLIFEPSYYEYDDAPRTIISNSLVYNNDTASGTNALLDSTAVIDGRRITLVTLNGSLSVSSMSTNVDLEPVSTPGGSLAIKNESSTDKVTLNLSTELNQTDWDLILEDQMKGNGGYVEDVTVDNTRGFANITLARTKGGEQVAYELTLAKIGVGNGITEEDGHYLTKTRGDRASVPEGGTQVLTVEVRDRLNNPVSGAQVNFSRDADLMGNLSSNEGVTGSNGQLSVTYEANTSLPPYILVNASITSVPGSGFNASHRQNVTFNLSTSTGIARTPTAMEGEWINAGHPPGVVIEDERADIIVNRDGNLEVTFTNNAASVRSMEFVRVSVAGRTCGIGLGTFCSDVATEWEIISEGTTREIGEPFTTNPLNLPGGNDISIDRTLEFRFTDYDGDEVTSDLQYFIISIKYQNAPTGTYYVPVPDAGG